MELSKSTGMGLSGRHFLYSGPQTLPHPTVEPKAPGPAMREAWDEAMRP